MNATETRISQAVTDAITASADACNKATAGVESAYVIVAADIAARFELTPRDETGVHLVLVKAQDACTTGPAWKTWRSGLESALKKYKLRLFSVRNKASGNGAFTLESFADRDARKASDNEKLKALAEKANAEALAAQAAADAAITPDDVAAGIVAECSRLGLDVISVIRSLMFLGYSVTPEAFTGLSDRLTARKAFGLADGQPWTAEHTKAQAEAKAAQAAQASKVSTKKAA